MIEENAISDFAPDDLVQRAIRGDKVALTILLARSRGALLVRIGRRISPKLQSVVAPEDIVQDTHIDVFHQLGSFEPRGPGSFERWVTTIAIRRLRGMIRRIHAAKRGGVIFKRLATC